MRKTASTVRRGGGGTHPRRVSAVGSGVVLLIAILLCSRGLSVTAFTTQKQDRTRHAAPSSFPAAVVQSLQDDATTATATTTTTTAVSATAAVDGVTTPERNPDPPLAPNHVNIPAFGITNGAAVAYGPYYYYTQLQKEYVGQGDDDDDEAVNVSTAVISCLLSLILGFGLGYGT